MQEAVGGRGGPGGESLPVQTAGCLDRTQGAASPSSGRDRERGTRRAPGLGMQKRGLSRSLCLCARKATGSLPPPTSTGGHKEDHPVSSLVQVRQRAGMPQPDFHIWQLPEGKGDKEMAPQQPFWGRLGGGELRAAQLHLPTLGKEGTPIPSLVSKGRTTSKRGWDMAQEGDQELVLGFCARLKYHPVSGKMLF